MDPMEEEREEDNQQEEMAPDEEYIFIERRTQTTVVERRTIVYHRSRQSRQADEEAGDAGRCSQFAINGQSGPHLMPQEAAEVEEEGPQVQQEDGLLEAAERDEQTGPSLPQGGTAYDGMQTPMAMARQNGADEGNQGRRLSLRIAQRRSHVPEGAEGHPIVDEQTDDSSMPRNYSLHCQANVIYLGIEDFGVFAPIEMWHKIQGLDNDDYVKRLTQIFLKLHKELKDKKYNATGKNRKGGGIVVNKFPDKLIRTVKTIFWDHLLKKHPRSDIPREIYRMYESNRACKLLRAMTEASRCMKAA